MPTLLLDRDLPDTRYCSRIWTVFSCRDGVYSPLERVQQGGDGQVFYFHPYAVYEALAAELLGVLPLRSEVPEKEAFDFINGNEAALRARFSTIVDSRDLAPQRVLDSLAKQIGQDFEALKSDDEYQMLDDNGPGVFVVGDKSDVLVHKSAAILPGTIFDVRDGPVIIDAGAEVGQFSFLSGPVYVGKETHVDNCRLLGPVVIGHNCRVGGEIEASIFGDFSNKHHEGFLGHSFVGRWVNIGALATTSDLKNNYGQVRLSAPVGFLDHPGAGLQSVETDAIKFGSIISDCAKIGIGMRLNTGTIIDMGCNVFNMDVPSYLAPFSWGGQGGQGEVYDIDRFQNDCRTIFARRGEVPSQAFFEISDYIWNGLYGRNKGH